MEMQKFRPRLKKLRRRTSDFMIITDVAPFDSRKRKIYVDGEYAFPLYSSEIRKFHIEAGREITDEVMTDIEELIVKRIRERILYLIGDMDRPESDIRKKLKANGYTDRYIDEAVGQIKEHGYIDDRRYARTYAQSLIDERHAGIALVRQKLYLKGISRDVINDTVAELEFNEEEQIEAALRKKNLTREEIACADPDTKRKTFAYLMRRGFSSSSVNNYIHN